MAFARQPSTWFSNLSQERKVYLVVLVTSATAAALTIFSESSDEQVERHLDRRVRVLGEGWSLLSRKQDIADFEWTFWFSELRESVLLALVGHVIISCFSARYVPWAKDGILAAYCVIWAFLAFGGEILAILLFVCMVFCVTSIISKSCFWCWCLTVSSILILHFDGFYMQIVSSVSDVSDAMLPLVYSTLGFTVLRCCSFCLERIQDRSSGSGEKYHFLRLLQYNFYLPYFFFGPVMTYDVFIEKTNELPTKKKLTSLLQESVKIISSVVMVDLLLHFVHFSSIAIDSEFLQSASVHVIGFILFCNVLLDWMKAFVLYRVTSGVAKVVDGYEGAPEAPKCTATICTFADTYFDRGIQHWVCRYIYDPVGEKHVNISKETLASVTTFVFVALWQGPGIQVITWATLNCLGLTFEFFISEMTPSEDKTRKRFVAIFLGLNYWCILLFNSVGINGMETARIGAKSAFFESVWNFTMAVLLGYCYAALFTLSPDSKMKQQ